MPANKLKDILAKHPNAVVLSREQYETLVRDAALDKKPAPAAPRRAALTEAKYQARLVGKVVQVTAALTVKVLADEWAQVPLDFGGAAIGAVGVDGEAALMPERVPQAVRVEGKAAPAANAALPTALLLRGRGERKIAVEFTLPVSLETGLSRVRIKLPSAAAGSFVFDLPPNQRVESPQPISIKKTPEMTSITAALSPANPVLELSWRGAGDAAQTLEPLVLANGIYTIDAEKVRAEFGFAIETQLGNLPAAFQIPLPANVKVLQVTGDELAKWEMADGKLNIALQAGERTAAKFWLALEMPSLAAAPRATLALPVPRIDGLARMQGVFSLIGDAGVTVEQVVTDGAATPTDRACDPVPHFIASYKFITPPTGPRVTVERVQPRFSADLDTLVEFRSEAVFIERTLTLHREKGDVFSTALTLPAGEETLAVRNADDSEPDWRMEGGKLRLRWSDLGGKNADRVFKIRTRIEPEKWTQLGADGLIFPLGDAQIDGAEKVTGYIALQADDSFRLEAEASETLERRDGRTTPVRGDYAWFRRADFALKVKVAKRPGEVLAALTGYALPLEGVLDLHAQMNFQFLYSGARSVRIRVPKELAANFNFDGPQIAERNLAGDIWTIVFQKELTGGYALKVTAQVPVAMAKDAAESRFTVALPVIAPLDVVRASGVWAVEANTETEITFDAKGMNELDSLLAPRLPEYQPRHRVIGVFAWLGADYALTLSGVRHAPAAVLTSVVDQLTLDTVVSTSGTERSQAVFQVRTAGAQYLDVRLPEKSRLLSLSVDDELVKPVGERADQVRVQLPAKRDATSAVIVSILYETPKGEWRGSGGYAARAPQLAKDIPILRSAWRLYLPDGFEYTGVESNLRVEDRSADAPLVATVFRSVIGIVNPSLGVAGASHAVVVNETPPPASEPASATPPPLAPAIPPANGITAEREISRRTEYEKRGEQMIESGDRAMKIGDYEKATAFYKNACDLIPNAALTQRNYGRALDGFCAASCKLAEQRIAEGRYADAENALRIVTDERYNPRCKEAIVILAHLEDPAFYNKTVGPQMRDNIEKVKQLFAEAQELYDNGRLDFAFKRCEQILNIDKYNKAARAMEEKIERAKSDFYVTGYNEQRSRAIPNTDAAWANPVRRFNVDAKDAGGGSKIQRKLERIIIPKLEFKEATIAEALSFLRKKSVELDPDEPKTGVIIQIKFDETPVADTRITVSLSNIPLIEALKYVTGLANLKFKVEPYAVSVVPQSVNTDVMITKEWKVRPDLLPNMKHGESADRESSKEWMISNGVQFNGAASAIYIVSSGRLIVRNTQDQLDLIDAMLTSAGSSARQTAGFANLGEADQQRVSGLLPMDIELPKVGRVMVLEGLSAAERVEFRYDDWWGRARRLWLWFVAGGLGCLFLARERPWWRTCWVVLVLTFIPLVVSAETMAICNALLAGWLVSVVLQRVAARVVFARGKREVVA